MWPLTLAVPKGLLPVGSRSLLHFAMAEAGACGIKKFVLVVDSAATASALKRANLLSATYQSRGHKEANRTVREWLWLVDRIVAIVWPDPRLPSGLAAGLLTVERIVKDDWFTVLSVDDLVLDAAQGLPREMAIWKTNRHWVIGLTRLKREQFAEFGVAKAKRRLDGCYDVINAQEKPGWHLGYRGFGIVGRYIVDQSIFQRIRECRADTLAERSQARFHITRCLDHEALRGNLLGAMVSNSYFHTGTMKGYLAAWRHYLRACAEDAPS